VEGAQDHVVSDPDERKPARPIVAAEHIRSEHNRHEAEEFDPYEMVLKRMLRLELGEVISEANRTYHYVHAGDDGHGEGTLVHMDKRFSDFTIAERLLGAERFEIIGPLVHVTERFVDLYCKKTSSDRCCETSLRRESRE